MMQPERPCDDHGHVWEERQRLANADRIRTCDHCRCGAIRYGVYAFRLDDQGQTAWGPVGEWAYKIEAKRARP